MKRSLAFVARLLTVGLAASAWAQALPTAKPEQGGLSAARDSFWIDPKEEMIAVWMAQGPGQREHDRRVFESLVLQAIAD